jgi:hypothetical protein
MGTAQTATSLRRNWLGEKDASETRVNIAEATVNKGCSERQG